MKRLNIRPMHSLYGSCDWSVSCLSFQLVRNSARFDHSIVVRRGRLSPACPDRRRGRSTGALAAKWQNGRGHRQLSSTICLPGNE